MSATKEEIQKQREAYQRLSMVVGVGYILLSGLSLWLTYKTVKLESEELDELEHRA